MMLPSETSNRVQRKDAAISRPSAVRMTEGIVQPLRIGDFTANTPTEPAARQSAWCRLLAEPERRAA